MLISFPFVPPTSARSGGDSEKDVRDQHNLSEHVFGKRLFQCPNCEKLFVDKDEMEEHNLSEHNFQCPNCEEHFVEWTR